MKKSKYPITIKIIKELDAGETPYVAYIPEFDVSSCGKTEKQAIKNVKEVLDILIIKAKAEHRLDELLTEAGFTRDNKSALQFPKIIIEPFSFGFSM